MSLTVTKNLSITCSDLWYKILQIRIPWVILQNCNIVSLAIIMVSEFSCHYHIQIRLFLVYAATQEISVITFIILFPRAHLISFDL